MHLDDLPLGRRLEQRQPAVHEVLLEDGVLAVVRVLHRSPHGRNLPRKHQARQRNPNTPERQRRGGGLPSPPPAPSGIPSHAAPPLRYPLTRGPPLMYPPTHSSRLKRGDAQSSARPWRLRLCQCAPNHASRQKAVPQISRCAHYHQGRFEVPWVNWAI